MQGLQGGVFGASSSLPGDLIPQMRGECDFGLVPNLGAISNRDNALEHGCLLIGLTPCDSQPADRPRRIVSPEGESLSEPDFLSPISINATQAGDSRKTASKFFEF